MATKDEIIAAVSEEVTQFLLRRTRLLSSEIGVFLNVNPFMLYALKDLHNLSSQRQIAEFMLIFHLGIGHATGFGKMMDEKVLPKAFGTVKLNSAMRRNRPFHLKEFDEIDHVVTRMDGQYLLSLKAGAWTIQHTMAMQMYESFKYLGDNNLFFDGIAVGVYYGHEGLLTNKYDIIRGTNRRRQGDLIRLGYVNVYAGKEFWSWLNNDEEETQDWVFEGIEVGTRAFSEEYTELANLMAEAPERLEEELRRKYSLSDDEEGTVDWYQLLHAVNNHPTDQDEPADNRTLRDEPNQSYLF